MVTGQKETALLTAAVQAGVAARPMPGLNQATAGRELNWPLVRRLATHHGIAAMLAEALRMTGWESVPLGTRQYLESVAAANKARLVLLTGECASLCRRMASAGIRVIPWKGPALAFELYPQPAVREFVDLDFLVAQADLRRAAQMLAELQFCSQYHWQSPQETAYWESYTGGTELHRSEGNLWVELHSHLLKRTFPVWLKTEQCLARAQRARLLGSLEVLALEPCDLLVSLAAHAMTHGWDRLKWIADFSAYLARYGGQVDWTELFARSRKMGSDRAVLVALGLARRLLAAELPPAAAQALARDRRAQRVVEATAQKILTGDMTLLRGASILRICSASMSRASHRSAYALRRLMMLSDEDLSYCRVPQGWLFLRFPIRAFRLASERLRSAA